MVSAAPSGEWNEKIKTMLLRIIFSIALCYNSLALLAQQTESPLGDYLQEDIPQRLFDVNSWEAAKEGIDYNQDIRVDRTDENFFDEEGEKANPTAPQQNRSNSDRNSGVGSFFFKLILIIALIIAVALIVARFVGGQGLKFRRNKKIDTTPINIDVEAVEEKLIESDIDRMIREAEEAGNFALALRLQYLAGVKALALNKHIIWKKSKTNRTYLYEIKKPEINNGFQALTLVFERIWYGDKNVNHTDYQTLKPQFLNFIKLVEQHQVKEELTTINE